MTAAERKTILNSELTRITDVLVRQYHPDKIILFGSLASGRVHEWSDIDLAIIKQTTRRFLDRIGEVLEIIQPQVGTNVIVYTPAEFDGLIKENRKFLVDEIIGKGKVLYNVG